MQAVILAGGKGLRLKAVTGDIPKPMVEVAGKPLLARIIEWLRRVGINEIVLCTGYGSRFIEEKFGDGKGYGVSIRYSVDKAPLGTAGALLQAKLLLEPEFLVVYGDVYSEANLSRLLAFHREKKAVATLAVHETDHPEDSDTVELGREARVINIYPKASPKHARLANAALYVMSKSVLDYVEIGKAADIAKDILPLLVEKGERVFGYETDEFIKDIGTPERLRFVENQLSKKPKPAVFLDRDGVINEEVDLLHRPDQLELIEGAAEGIKALNEKGLPVIVVTNQPVVARNLCTELELERIHATLKLMLERKGAKIDAIYYCPHHPEKGHPDANPKYRIECECRKPKTGMLRAAQKNFNIDLTNSYMVGDATTDIETGRNAGCRTILLKTGYGGKDKKFNVAPDHTFDNLRQACEFVIRQNENI